MAKGKILPKVATTSKSLDALLAARGTGLNDAEDGEPPRRAPRTRQTMFDYHMARITAARKRKA